MSVEVLLYLLVTESQHPVGLHAELHHTLRKRKGPMATGAFHHARMFESILWEAIGC